MKQEKWYKFIVLTLKLIGGHAKYWLSEGHKTLIPRMQSDYDITR